MVEGVNKGMDLYIYTHNHRWLQVPEGHHWPAQPFCGVSLEGGSGLYVTHVDIYPSILRSILASCLLVLVFAFHKLSSWLGLAC
jgi:hypothetical protein